MPPSNKEFQLAFLLADGIILACVFEFCSFILVYIICVLLIYELDLYPLYYMLTLYFRQGLESPVCIFLGLNDLCLICICCQT